MKKIWKSRLMALFLCLSMLLPALPETVQAADSSFSYVALGDSITTGYGLAAGESNFATILAGSDLTLNNLAADGETSGQLITKLSDQTYQTYVKNADLITLSIGGNDLMNALYEYLAEQTNLSADAVKKALMDKTDPNRIIVLPTAMTTIGGFAQSTQAKSAIAEFSQNFSTIINIISGLNPNAMIVVLNQYNPYSHLNNPATTSIVSAFDAGVSALNSVFNIGASNGAYKLANVYSAFESTSENPCNAYFNSTDDLNLDFHPNAYGHQLIADTIEGLNFREELNSLNRVTASGDTYDRNGINEITYTYSCPSGDLTSLEADGKTLTKYEDYDVYYKNRVIINKKYLNELLENGELLEGSTVKLTFRFSEGNSVTKSLFIPETYKVTVNSEPNENWGYFSANGYSKGSTNVYYAIKGEKVELNAHANMNYTFNCWKQGDKVISEDACITITPESDIEFTMVFSPAPCSLELSPAELDFGVVDVTYEQPDARTVTITNVGENAAVLIIPSSEHYVIDELSEYRISPGSSATFTVRPEANLAAGKYNESITVYAISADSMGPRALYSEDEVINELPAGEVINELPAEATVAAELKVSFQVGKDPVLQPETNEKTPTTTTNESNVTTAKKSDVTTVKTGDNNHVFLWLLLLAVSGSVAGTFLVTNKKRKTNR